MDKIRSAYEMAMERFKQRKEVPRGEIDRMEHIPIGKAIAAKYLREKDYDIFSEANKYSENMRGYILEGAQETILSNILLPLDKATYETNKKAMEGILQIKKNRQAASEILGQIEHLFRYYESSVEQAYSRFKEMYTAKLSSSLQSLGKRVGAKIKIDPEKQPGFREEWLKAIGSLSVQYEQLLGEQKGKLRNIK